MADRLAPLSQIDPAIQALQVPGEDLHRLGRLQRCDQVHDRADDAAGVAGRGTSGRRQLFQDAAQTGGQSWDESQAQSVTTHTGAIDPGKVPLDTGVVQKIARFEIVGSIDNQIVARYQ